MCSSSVFGGGKKPSAPKQTVYETVKPVPTPEASAEPVSSDVEEGISSAEQVKKKKDQYQGLKVALGGVDSSTGMGLNNIFR